MANRLREVVKERFYPLLETRGFVRAKSGDSRFVFFAKVAETETFVLFFQWDKHGGERFVINLSKLPRGSEPQTLGPFDVEWMARLQPSGASARWWSTRKPLLAALASLRLKLDPHDVVNQAADAFGEAESWWECGLVGDHIQTLTDLPPNNSLERTRER